jgi:cubilin
MSVTEKCTTLLITAIIVGVTFTATVEGQGLCGNRTLEAGVVEQNLTSPGYPNIYPNNMTCQWMIMTFATSSVVVLNVLDFYLEGAIPNCVYDYVDFHNGVDTTDPAIARLCGHVPSAQITSSGSYMSVLFHSDLSNTNKGFKLGYAIVEKSVLCGNSTYLASDLEQNITSPGYPFDYPRNMQCQWSISADSSSSVVVLNVQDFSLEASPTCVKDHVTFYDGNSTNYPTLAQLCGTGLNTQIISTGPSMTVVFSSDSMITDKGFALEYRSQQKSDVCTKVALLANGTGQYITSPGYPNYHPGLPACHWSISADSSSRVVELKLLDFGLGSSASCSTDFVEVYDGNSTLSPRLQLLCGQVQETQFVSTGRYMTVVFHSSNSSNTNKGFKFEYTSSEKSGLCGNTTLLAYDVEQYITSPDYPKNYPSDTDCLWIISADTSTRAVVLQLLDFYLDGYIPYCDSDSVTFYDGNSTSSLRLQVFCGPVLEAHFASTGPFMTVVFHSDSRFSYSGFKLAYTSSEKSDLCRNVTLTATANVNYIASPDYPDNYPSNVSCQWSISANSSSSVVVLKLLDFFLEGTLLSCSTDYVEIYDGSSSNSSRIQLLCGQVPNTQFTSSGPYLFVAFHSDLSSNYRGFKLEYTSQEKSALCSNVPLLATEHVNYITSPNYPNNYPR